MKYASPYTYLIKIICIFALFAGACHANQSKQIPGELRLAAMVDGAPAFQQALWKLTLTKNSNKIIKTLHRHSALIELEPGQYAIELTMQGKTYQREIAIRSGASHQLIIQTD